MRPFDMRPCGRMMSSGPSGCVRPRRLRHRDEALQARLPGGLAVHHGRRWHRLCRCAPFSMDGLRQMRCSHIRHVPRGMHLRVSWSSREHRCTAGTDIGDETAWPLSGGGFSDTFDIPSWQADAVFPPCSCYAVAGQHHQLQSHRCQVAQSQMRIPETRSVTQQTNTNGSLNRTRKHDSVHVPPVWPRRSAPHCQQTTAESADPKPSQFIASVPIP